MEKSLNLEPSQNHQFLALASNTFIDDSNPLAILRSFPQELITEILLRLPVISLVKFKCVSRSWCSLISSPQFIKAHFKINSSKSTQCHLLMWSVFESHYHLRQCSLDSMLYDDTDDGMDLKYPARNHDRYVSYVGNHNGLVCICVGKQSLFLWNPSIRKSIRFPYLDVESNRIDMTYFVDYGFGYDEANDDYKVVCIVCLHWYLDQWGENRVYVCSVKSQSWRRIGNFEGGYPRESSRGVFLNGKIHWSLEKETSGCITSLDLATESYGRIEEPEHEKGPVNLGILDGCLCLLANSVAPEVWVMKEHPLKESWTKVLSFPCNPMRSLMYTPLCISRKGEFFMVLGRVLALYDPERKEFKQVKNFVGMIYNASLFVESLVVPGAH